MPHTATTIYSETRNGVKYGVQLRADICPVLGIDTTSVPWACSNAHGRINKWAMFKPVILDNLSIFPSDTMTVTNPFNGVAMTVKATMGTPMNKSVTIDNESIPLFVFYGIGMPMLRTGDDFALRKRWIDRLASHPEINWPYFPPVLGVNRSRMSHFDGYDHLATPPIQYYVSDCYTQHFGRVTAIWTDESFSDKVINMQELARFLNMDMTVKCDIVKKSTGDLYETLTLGSLDQSIDTTSLYGPYSVSQDTTLQAYFYAIGKNGSDNWCILFPSLPGFPNPMEMTAHKKTGDVQESMLTDMDLISPGCGFAYTHSSAFFESFSNVGEGFYSRLLTNGSYCIRAKVTNTGTTAATITKSDISLIWGESGSTLFWLLYHNGSSVNTVSVPAKSTVTLDLEIINIFEGMTPTDGTDYGDVDYLIIKYRGQMIPATIFAAVRKVANSDSHLGWFLSQNIGYYQSR